MKLLMICHMAVPVHNAGGETTVHAAFRAMVDRGHEVKVICKPHSNEKQFSDYVYDRVQVFRCPDRDDQNWMRNFAHEYDPDLLLTHLDLTPQAMQLSLDIKRPLAHFAHNTMQFDFHRVTPFKCQLAIFNSQWVADAQEWPGPQIVIHPVVEPDRYRCERGTKVTLVNPTPGKGADTFYALSKELPDLEFLTVKSVYGEQIAPPNIAWFVICPSCNISNIPCGVKAEQCTDCGGDLEGGQVFVKNFPNVETMKHTADIREAFRKTMVLLMPSNYESYGRVAVEAACCGIPTIAHPTPGLKESLGEAGIFHDRDDIPAWKASIERLYSDEVYYRKRSDLALQLANSLDPEGEFDRLEEALLVTVSNWNNPKDESMQIWVTDREIYKDADGNLTLDRAQGISLYRGKNQRMPLSEAQSLGLGHPQTGANEMTAHQVERDLDTKALSAPPENKAIESPDQTKKKKRSA